MQVRDNVLPHLRRVKAELEKLNGTRIKIGIQGNADSELLMIARVHEYGATITPKATRNLCIPIHKDSYDKSQRRKEHEVFCNRCPYLAEGSPMFPAASSAKARI